MNVMDKLQTQQREILEMYLNQRRTRPELLEKDAEG